MTRCRVGVLPHHFSYWPMRRAMPPRCNFDIASGDRNYARRGQYCPFGYRAAKRRHTLISSFSPLCVDIDYLLIASMIMMITIGLYDYARRSRFARIKASRRLMILYRRRRASRFSDLFTLYLSPADAIAEVLQTWRHTTLARPRICRRKIKH